MEHAERLPLALRSVAAGGLDPRAIATWLLAALLVVYLGLENGGYDPIQRSEVGVAVWWVLLLGTAVGALPLAGRTRAGLLSLGLLTAFAAWIALSLGWTESAERTATELARVATYLGVFALALAAQGAGRGRQLLNGVTFGVAVLAAVGVLSRLHPAWFPPNELGTFLSGVEIERRLAYPLNYTSAMGALAAIGLPLVLAATASARTLPGQALAAAALPVVGLTLYLSASAMGAAAAAVALAAFLVLAPDRLPKLATLVAGSAGTAILAAAIDQRAALDRGLPTEAAQRQGDEVLLMALVVCVGVALVQVGIALAVRYGSRPRWLSIGRRQARVATALAIVAAIPIALAADLPGEVSETWETFKSREGTAASNSDSGAILDPSSSGRYQFWQSAADANETRPLTGIGAGTFEFWWARNGLYAGFIRDAHSLFMETLAELGIVGLLLIASFVLGVLAIGAARALRSPPAIRLPLAAATAGCAAFAVAAGLDWMWELAALAIIFMLLAAVAVEGWASESGGAAAARRRARGRWAVGRRIAVAGLSIAALFAIGPPLLGAWSIRDSQIKATSGDLSAAVEEARSAADAQPYAATPQLQEALVLELQGKLDLAASAAREATRKESTNWRTWLTLSRIEAERGRAKAALDAYREARSLNPRSGAFAQ